MIMTNAYLHVLVIGSALWSCPEQKVFLDIGRAHIVFYACQKYTVSLPSLQLLASVDSNAIKHDASYLPQDGNVRTQAMHITTKRTEW